MSMQMRTGYPSDTCISEVSDHSTNRPAHTGRIWHGGYLLRLIAVSVMLLSLASPLSQSSAVAAGAQPMTILIMGVNAPPETSIDVGVRPIALTVMRVDPATGSCSNLGISSDSLVELPGYGESKIRHALMVGGVPYQMLVTETYLGIDIDHYVLVDFTGFETLIDAVDGVKVDVAPDLTSPSIPNAGVQTVNGAQALAHARYGGDGDFVRIERQQALIDGIVDKLAGLNLISEANAIVPAVEDHLRTDMSIKELAAAGKYFNSYCSNGAMQMNTIPGDLVPVSVPDPLLGVPLTYVVSDPAVVQSKVDEFLGIVAPSV